MIGENYRAERRVKPRSPRKTIFFALDVGHSFLSHSDCGFDDDTTVHGVANGAEHQSAVISNFFWKREDSAIALLRCWRSCCGISSTDSTSKPSHNRSLELIVSDRAFDDTQTFGMNLHTTQHGYQKVSTVPYVAGRSVFYETSHLPKFQDDLFTITNTSHICMQRRRRLSLSHSRSARHQFICPASPGGIRLALVSYIRTYVLGVDTMFSCRSWHVRSVGVQKG